MIDDGACTRFQKSNKVLTYFFLLRVAFHFPPSFHTRVKNGSTNGRSNSGSGNIECLSCPKGRILQKKLPLLCTVCQGASYQPIVHLDFNIACQTCSSGRYMLINNDDDTKHDTEDKCLYCPIGHEYTSSTTKCNICSAGRYQDEKTAVGLECKYCPEGRFNGDEKTVQELHINIDKCKNCTKGKFSQAGDSECTKEVRATNMPTPNNIIIFKMNDTALLVSWELPETTASETKPAKFEVHVSTERLFRDNDQLIYTNISLTAQSIVASNLKSPLWLQVYYARVRSVDSEQLKGVWSETSEKWTVGNDCNDAASFLNESFFNKTTSNNPQQWFCQRCPPGGYCTGAVRWESMIQQFGYAPCPINSTIRFASCPFSAACKGGPNIAFEGKFQEDGIDPANCPIENPNCTIGCSIAYRNDSKLCGACADGFSHADLSGKCDTCPEDSTNVALAVGGGICGILGIIIYVNLALSDGGQVEAADGVMSITLSFIQLVSLLTTFPIAWPRIFVSLFAVGGAVTVLGQHLVNLKCLFPTYTEAEVFYAVLLL
jgi:hypothetical protein